MSQPLSIFFEFAGDELADCFDRGIGIDAIGADGNDRAVTGGEHHEAHDAFTIHFLTIFFHEDVCLKAIGRFDELGCWTGMDAELVQNGEIFFGHEWKLALEGE